uniref:EF-hand domain-containing protein n=1 Tax=Plectus sambesii TaxID=2011161 RepID=A0A914WDM3_9BILA
MTNFFALVALIATVSILPSIAAQDWERDYDDLPYSYGSIKLSNSKLAAIFFENALSDNNTALTLDDFLRMNSIYQQILATEKVKFALLDTNNDGKVTEKEQSAFMQRLKDQEKIAQVQRFQLYIDECDKGDGKMQALEFEEFLQDHLNLKPIENVTIAQLMKPFDTDLDGALSDAELYEFVYNKPTAQLVEYKDDNYPYSTDGYSSSTDGYDTSTGGYDTSTGGYDTSTGGYDSSTTENNWG